MLSIILWVLGGIVIAWILYWVGVFVFTLLGIKKVLNWASSEVQQLPDEYANMRKQVKNENSNGDHVEKFVKNTFVRWYEKLFK
jgi:hypothetical protein